MTENVLETHVIDCFQINGENIMKMEKKVKRQTLKFKYYTKKIKKLFMIYADFESILIPENNGSYTDKYESYTNKYQIHLG